MAKNPQKRAALYNMLASTASALREEGVDFLIVLNKGTKEDHNYAVSTNIPNDHHMLDMLAAVVDSWRKANH